jgi:hypothetical protein
MVAVSPTQSQMNIDNQFIAVQHIFARSVITRR